MKNLPARDAAGTDDWRSARRYQQNDPADRLVLDDLERQFSGLKFIDTPVWVFDPERCQCLWANPSGLEIWRAPSVVELQGRDVAATQSEAVYTLLNDYLRRVEEGEHIAVWVTLDPRGTTRRFYQSHHLVTLADGRKALLIEAQAEPPAEEMLAFASDYTLTIGLYELDGTLVSGNPAFRRLGERHELDNLNLLMPTDGSLLAWPRLLGEQSQLVFEREIDTARGRGLYRCELRRVFTKDRHPRAILTLYDLTEQRIRQSEQALRDNQLRTEHLLDSAEVATYVWDVARNVFALDHRWWSMLGYSLNAFEFTLDVWADLLHPEDSAALQEAAARLLSGELTHWNNEYRLRTADGSYRWILDRGLVTRKTPDGKPLEVGGIHLDVHPQKLVESALGASEMRQRALLGAVPDLLCIHERDGRLMDFHAARPEDWLLPTGAIGMTMAEMLPPDAVAELKSAQAEVLGRRRSVQGEYRVEHPQKGQQFREYRMVPYGEHQTLTLVRNVTDRHVAEGQRLHALKQLQQAQKMDALGQLTGGIAHDFNNILASMMGYAWLARQLKPVKEDEKAAEYLSIISAAGERGRELIQKMMSFSRRAPATPGVQAVEPLPVLEDAFRMLKSIIPSRLNLTLALDPALPRISVEPIDLHQVLVNLVVNSRDATPGHGEIAVSMTQRRYADRFCASCHESLNDEYVTLAVVDSGSGIPAATLERIFDPFFTTKEVGAGTGIGLSMVDGIVHRHGGHVLVSSEPGVGTQFEILLPGVAAPAPQEAPAGAPVADPAGERLARGKLLVVDDEPWVAAFLSELLRLEGYTVEVFDNGRDALAALASAAPPFDAVVSDFMMPHMTGLELASAIQSRYPGLPVVLCTGTGEPPDEAALQLAGVRRLFPKPVPVEELQQLLMTMLALRGTSA